MIIIIDGFATGIKFYAKYGNLESTVAMMYCMMSFNSHRCLLLHIFHFCSIDFGISLVKKKFVLCGSQMRSFVI